VACCERSRCRTGGVGLDALAAGLRACRHQQSEPLLYPFKEAGPLSARRLPDNQDDVARRDSRPAGRRRMSVAGAGETRDAGHGSAPASRQLMHDPGSLNGIAFRYARWLRDTGQWDAMDLFTGVIHPAVGWLAGRGQASIMDISPSIIRRTVLVARRDGVDPELAIGVWSDFLEYLDIEGIPHRPLPPDLLAMIA
jgi:hypothetical protein